MLINNTKLTLLYLQNVLLVFYYTWKWDVGYDYDHAQNDGDDTEHTRQSSQPPGPVYVPRLQAVSGLHTQKTQSITKRNILMTVLYKAYK